jgi:hypothetical protein
VTIDAMTFSPSLLNSELIRERARLAERRPGRPRLLRADVAPARRRRFGGGADRRGDAPATAPAVGG